MSATVLVVDDDLDIRATLAQVLREEGFRVCTASNGLEALEKVADERPDLVLLDLMMPVLNGWEVLETLKRCRGDLPIVVVSAFRAPGVELIEKPISYERLMRLLDAVRSRTPSLVGNDAQPDARKGDEEPEPPPPSE